MIWFEIFMSEGGVKKSIGNKFERYLGDRFPDLRSTSDDSRVPDFWNPYHEFWIEAKAGNIEWGTRMKGYQINENRGFDDSTIYALGFHNLDDANKRVTQKTERGRQAYLDRHLRFQQVNFITQSLMERLWKKETRTSKKKSEKYCMMKESTLNNVFQNRWFSRFGVVISPEQYYGFSYQEYVAFVDPHLKPFWRAILDPEKDKGFIDFMRKYELALESVEIGKVEDKMGVLGRGREKK